MTYGMVVGIYISPAKGEPMQEVEAVEAIEGRGLQGDRYCTGEGSWNWEKPGKRQVTLINYTFFAGTNFTVAEARRNIIAWGVELMRLIGQEFQIGTARMKGVKYCYPCGRPAQLAGKDADFAKEFFDRAGLIAEVIVGGTIRVNDLIIPLEPKANAK